MVKGFCLADESKREMRLAEGKWETEQSESCAIVKLIIYGFFCVILGALGERFCDEINPPNQASSASLQIVERIDSQNLLGGPRSGSWPRARREHLAQFPTCAACGGSENLTVHHVEPFQLNPAKELDPDNLITLCESPSHNCHFIFGHLCDWKSWNESVRADAARYLKEIKNRPHIDKQSLLDLHLRIYNMQCKCANGECEQAKPLFSYFGAKAAIAPEVWRRFGTPRFYCEPFFGSGAMLFAAPTPARAELVNDIDGLVANFFRVVKSRPKQLTKELTGPSAEVDHIARKKFLRENADELTERLKGDIEFCDVKSAAHWVRALSAAVRPSPKRLSDKIALEDRGIYKRGCDRVGWIQSYSERLKNVKIFCRDWRTIFSPSYLDRGNLAIFLDPPYGEKAKRASDLYRIDSLDVFGGALDFCKEQGKRKNLRIALCCYEGEAEQLKRHGWRSLAWNSSACNPENENRERVWFSPHCLSV